MILGDVMRRNARLGGDTPLLIFDGRVFGHRAFAERVFRLANALIALGIQRGERIAILSQNCLEYLEVYGAGELCGWCTVTVNYRLAAAEMRYILEDSRPRFLIYEPNYANTVAELRPGLPFIEHFIELGDGYEAALTAAAPTLPPLRATPDDIVYLIYTSGTTGRPKGVMLTQAGQVAAAQIMAVEHCVEPTDIFAITMPLYHIGGKLAWMAGTWCGCTIVLLRAWRPREFADAIATHRVTGALLAPPMLADLLDLADTEPVDLSSLRKIYYSAAPMPLPLLRRAIDRLGPIFTQFYGMTEAGGPATTLHRHQHLVDGPESVTQRLSSAGQPSPGCDVRIVRADGADCAVDEPGEIVVRSAALMRGYWNNSVATAETLRNGWLHTGDIGTRDAEWFVTVVDRLKDMIISGGENIYSREVERAIMTHPGVAEVAVVGRPDKRWGETVVAFVARKPGAALTGQQVVTHCRTTIAAFKRPREVRFLDALPKLPNGKVEKPKLRALLTEVRQLNA